MGGNVTVLPPPPVNSTYFSLTFRMSDKIWLIDCNEQCLELIQKVAAANWSGGIQSQWYDNGVFEIEFSGHAFSKSTNKAEALASKRLCCALLISLHSAGWELCVSSDLSQTKDLTTWFFKKNPAIIRGRQLTAEGGIFCLSLSSTNKLQLVNAPKYLQDELLQCVGSQLQNHKAHGRDFVMKLVGYPWLSASFEEDRSYIGGETRYCMLFLNDSDRILLIDCPQPVVSTVGHCIAQYWAGGIQYARQKNHYVEYALKGYPWHSYGDNAINSSSLITIILQSLASVGWTVMSALDISRKDNDKAVFILRSCAPASIPHLCISASGEDLIRLINAPQDIRNAVAGVIHCNWPYGIQREGTRLRAYEWKLKGYPWSADGGNDYAISRRLVIRLLSEMARLDWRVICSADVSAKFIHQENGFDYQLNVHSWYFACTGQVDQPLDAAGSSSSVSLVTPPAPSSEVYPPPPSYSEVVVGSASPSASSSEAFPPPPSYGEVMNK